MNKYKTQHLKQQDCLEKSKQQKKLPPLGLMVNEEGGPRKKGQWRRVARTPKHRVIGTLVCEKCKKSFSAKSYQVRRKQRFCSPECRYGTAEERFFSKIKKDSKTGCWIWIGSRVSNRYGGMIVNFKHMLAHRYSYELHNGKIKNDLYVCHKCDNGFCVNPDHLFLGTQKDNMDDMIKKGRGFFQK
jgi:hypothetical protein